MPCARDFPLTGRTELGRRARRRPRQPGPSRSQKSSGIAEDATQASSHTAHCLCGRQVTGLAMLTGVVIPPAGGPARRAVLLEKGTSYLLQSRRQYSAVLAALPGRVAALLPAWAPLEEPVAAPTPLERQPMEQRSAAWAQAQNALHEEAGQEEHSRLERRARGALDAAVTAFNFLEDEDHAGATHQHAHTVAEFVGRLFGCQVEYRDRRFWDVCPLSLMHLRIGLSPGFTGPRLCSVCRQDLSECPHVPGVAVTVVVEEREGHCSACNRPWPCTQHLRGIALDVFPHAVIPDMDLDEVSWVDRPREPRARITGVELPDALLRAQLGRLPTEDEPVVCHRCQQPCQGLLTSADLLHITPFGALEST